MKVNKKSCINSLLRWTANFLAVFLIALSIADGAEDGDLEVIHEDYHLSVVDYDYVDFPTSIARSQSVNFSKIQRHIILPLGISFSFGLVKLFEVGIPQPQLVTIHPLLFALIELVICTNAP